jgi:hypothetical protein
MPDTLSAVIWLNSLRAVLGRLRRLVSGLNDEPNPSLKIFATEYACRSLYDLRNLIEILPHDPVEDDEMVAIVEANLLVEGAPWPHVPDTSGLRITFKLDQYVRSIDPRSLERILDRLSGVEAPPVAKPEAPPDEGGEWLGASIAVRRLKDKCGIRLSLATVGRHRKKDKFKSRDGGIGCVYEVEWTSFLEYELGQTPKKSAQA